MLHIIWSVSQVITSLYRYAPTIGAKEVTRYVKRVWILVGQVEVESTNDARFELAAYACSATVPYARHDDGLTEVNTMTKPKCVDFKVCGDFALSAGASERSYYYERC